MGSESDGGHTMSRQTAIVVGVLLVASFVVILNETIMSVALPSLMADLNISAAVAQWVTTGFLLTMAVVIPTTGLILQRFGTRSIFVAAMSLFTAGTALAAAAPGFGLLLTGRILQASGTAIMLPLLTTTVMSSVPERRRGRTVGLISIVIAVAPAVGPTISGVMLSSLGWRWLFLFVLPIAVLSLGIGARFVHSVSATRAIRVDVSSVLLSAIGFGGLIFGLSSIGEAAEGKAPVPVAVPMAVGVVALALFVARQLRLQRTDAALMDLRPFKSRTFAIGTVTLLVAMAVLLGTLVLLPIFMQSVLGMSTMRTGLLLLPGGLTMGLLAPLVGRIFDRYGARPAIIPGTLIIVAALAAMAMLDRHVPALAVAGAHVLLSVGLALALTPLMTATLGSLNPSQYSHGSAIVNTLQQLAGAAGTAMFVSIMTARSQQRVGAGIDHASLLATGTRSAFAWGAALALVAVIVSLFLPRPTSTTS
ncbi:DHA2 family efflux MFS transporter permease subunit [Nocardia sp. CA2R105]|nr:DHA2 family efflux MFS transporter permease subunit [Nocardia coffeae]